MLLRWIGVLLWLCPNFASAKGQMQVADVGFASSPYYIQTIFEAPLMEIIFEFALCNTQTEKCIRLNECRYSEREIRPEMDALRDLDWFFYRSDVSPVELEEFYPLFRDLLSRIDKARGEQECGIDELQNLKDQITHQQG